MTRQPLTTLRITDAIRECIQGVGRYPARSGLAGVATAVGVGVIVAVTGIGDSASAAVRSAFYAQRPTQVTFLDTAPTQRPVFTEASAERLARLSGVVHAGVVWQLGEGQPFPVERTSEADPTGQEAVQLPVLAASWSALTTIAARPSAGRLYDAGFESRHEMVGLLGATAASQLGITNLSSNPAVFINGSAITIIGIIGNVSQQAEALVGLVVTPYVASVISSARDAREIIADTVRGAAPTIGRQGPYVISPYDPARVDAQVPADPVDLQNAVESPVNALLRILGIVALSVGIVAISNATLLSVLQRRPEIGLRRALGFRPQHILALVLGEAALIGAWGGTTGAGFGVFVVAAVAELHSWQPILNPMLFVLAPLVGVVTGAVAGLYPALRAARIDPVAALRSA